MSSVGYVDDNMRVLVSIVVVQSYPLGDCGLCGFCPQTEVITGWFDEV